MIRKIATLTSLLVAFSINYEALAASATTTTAFQTSSTLSGECMINVPSVSFGTYNAANADATTANQNIAVQCTKGTAYTLFTVIQPVSWTLYQSSPVGIMVDNAGNSLYFQVYIPSAGTWANDNNYNSSYHLQSTGTGLIQNFNMTYRILPNQYTTPNDYSVTETAYVNF